MSNVSLFDQVEWFLRNNHLGVSTENRVRRATLCVKLEELTRKVLAASFSPHLVARLGYLLWQANDLGSNNSADDLAALELLELHYDKLHKDVMGIFPPGSSGELEDEDD